MGEYRDIIFPNTAHDRIGLSDPVNYLLSYRLQWGKCDTLSKLPSRLDLQAKSMHSDGGTEPNGTHLPQVPPGAKNYFTADISDALISIIMNDWPYSGACLRLE